MKTGTLISKAVACGVAAAILCAASTAEAALTPAQIQMLAIALRDDVAGDKLAGTAAGLVNSQATSAQKLALAKDIAAHLGSSVNGLGFRRVSRSIASMAVLIPDSAPDVVAAAVTGQRDAGGRLPDRTAFTELVVRAAAQNLPNKAASIAAAVAQTDVKLAVSAARGAVLGAGTQYAEAIGQQVSLAAPGVQEEVTRVVANPVATVGVSNATVLNAVNPLNVSVS